MAAQSSKHLTHRNRVRYSPAEQQHNTLTAFVAKAAGQVKASHRRDLNHGAAEAPTLGSGTDVSVGTDNMGGRGQKLIYSHLL